MTDQSFFGRNWYVFDWDYLPLKEVSKYRRGSIQREAWVWFNENADAICRGYIRKQHGTIEQAMIFFGTFDALFTDFKNYFTERKYALMEKVENALQVQKTKLAQRGEKPQSYGGVANLLKVLQKTSLEQGNSIQTIAKVQFAVCMQAGIMIPNEFLTDVMAATDGFRRFMPCWQDRTSGGASGHHSSSVSVFHEKSNNLGGK